MKKKSNPGCSAKQKETNKKRTEFDVKKKKIKPLEIYQFSRNASLVVILLGNEIPEAIR